MKLSVNVTGRVRNRRQLHHFLCDRGQHNPADLRSEPRWVSHREKWLTHPQHQPHEPRGGRPVSSTAHRERQALRLRSQGLTFEQIALELGLSSRASAYKAYRRAMDPTRSHAAGERRRQELHLIELKMSAIWPAAARGDLTAVDLHERLTERRDRIARQQIPEDDTVIRETAPEADTLEEALRPPGGLMGARDAETDRFQQLLERRAAEHQQRLAAGPVIHEGELL